MKSSLRAVLAVAMASALMAAGCGDDDESGRSTADAAGDSDSGTTGPEGSSEAVGTELTAYCEATLALETLPEPDYDLDIPGAAGNWVTHEVRPVVTEMVAAAPAEIADDLGTVAAAVDSVAESSDLAEFGTDEVDAAEARLHAFDLENCGWQEQQITATEYRFGGAPTALDAGTVSFEVSNEGSEVHELVLQRKNDGVTESAADLANLPADEAAAKTTEVGSVLVDPGARDYKVLDLQPGEYIMVCFVPVGTTSADTPAMGGAPHYMEGMLAEFTVG
jgi:hypothetical protein